MDERKITLTCETKDCENQNIPMVLFTNATQYMCGACGQYITNAVEVVEEVIDGTAEETV